METFSRNVDSMAVSSNYCALAAKGKLYIVDLNEPDKVKQSLTITDKKWTNGAVQVAWEPMSVTSLASTCGNTVSVWDVPSETIMRSWTPSQRSLHCIDYSSISPESPLLVTSSDEKPITIIDTRQAEPANTLASPGNTFQVRWSRYHPHIIASTHDGSVRIWDLRTGSTLSHFSAHIARILHFDWSFSDPDEFLTCAPGSQDGAVRLWDRAATDLPKATIPDPHINKAVFTPFGRGVVTTASSRLEGTAEVLMWSVDALMKQPEADYVCPFPGKKHMEWTTLTFTPELMSPTSLLHPSASTGNLSLASNLTNIVPQGSATGSTHAAAAAVTSPSLACAVGVHALVTWSDQGVMVTVPDRSHCIEVGFTPPDSWEANMGRSRYLAGESFYNSQYPQNLAQEFHRIHKQPIKGVSIGVSDVGKRYCEATIIITKPDAASHVAKLNISFPALYPNNAPPSFEFLGATTLRAELKQQVRDGMMEVAQRLVEKSKPCLEPCLSKAIEILQTTLTAEDAPLHARSASFGKAGPLKVAPKMIRTSGACFSPSGALVYFSNRVPMKSKKQDKSGRSSRIRASPRVDAYGNRDFADGSVTPLTMMLSRPKASRGVAPSPSLSTMSRLTSAGASSVVTNIPDLARGMPNSVLLMDAAPLLLLDRQLCEKYRLMGEDPAEVCLANAAAAQAAGRPDLVKTWTLAAQVMRRTLFNPAVSAIPWHMHPFGGKLVKSLLDHYLKLRDIQTVAVLACITQLPKLLHERATSVSYQVRRITAADVDSVPKKLMKKMTGSVFYDHDVSHDDSVDEAFLQMLSPSELDSFAMCQSLYSSVLLSWGLPSKSAEIRKFALGSDAGHAPEHAGRAVYLVCPTCKKESDRAVCETCNEFVHKCSICRIPTRWLANVCVMCGHGGHPEHIREWFAKNTTCASGCGCQCMTHDVTTLPALELEPLQ